MASCSASRNLFLFLEENCEKLHEPKSTILFKRGEKVFGMFLILSGIVSLEFETDSVPSRLYGPGTLIGLPATLTKRNYSMTASVMEDAQLGFLSPEVLDSLVRKNPDLSHELLTLLSDRILEIQRVQKDLLDPRDQLPRTVNKGA